MPWCRRGLPVSMRDAPSAAPWCFPSAENMPGARTRHYVVPTLSDSPSGGCGSETARARLASSCLSREISAAILRVGIAPRESLTAAELGACSGEKVPGAVFTVLCG